MAAESGLAWMALLPKKIRSKTNLTTFFADGIGPGHPETAAERRDGTEWCSPLPSHTIHHQQYANAGIRPLSRVQERPPVCVQAIAMAEQSFCMWQTISRIHRLAQQPTLFQEVLLYPWMTA